MALQMFQLLLFAVGFLLQHVKVSSHGGMVEPPMRSIMWRYGFDAPVNYDWNALYCGGRQNFVEHRGKCGFCGDPVQGPFDNDKGGIYDNGIIVRHYPAGLQTIEVKVEITAHHKGFFQFKLCANNEGPITQECLDRHPLRIQEAMQQGDPLRYYPPVTPKLNELHVVLPPDVVCDRCVLQWTYTAGNSVGQSADGRSCLGCGLQETFVNCADISIGGTKDKVTVHKNQPQGGAVVEIGNNPDVTAALGNIQPDASVEDVLRQLGVNIPRGTGTLTPGAGGARPDPGTPPVVRPQLIQPRPPFATPVQPRAAIDQNVQSIPTPILPENRERNIFPVPRTIPRPMPRRPTIEAPSSGPDISGPHRWDLSEFPSPPGRHDLIHQHELPIGQRDHPELLSGLHPMEGGLVSTHRQRKVAEAYAGGEIDTEVSDPWRRRHRNNINGPQTETGLVDAVYALRDRVPQRDVYGNIISKSSRNPQSHDPYSRAKQLREHYMKKLQSLGRHMHRSLSEYHNEYYRDAMRNSGYPDNDNYLYHKHKPSVIRESAHEAPEYRHKAVVLPRRIMVHSISLAKNLLRKYPALRGRIFLSKMAHMQNKYARMLHRYAKRHRRP